jgi:hypothetical protein
MRHYELQHVRPPSRVRWLDLELHEPWGQVADAHWAPYDANAQAILTESELLRAMFDIGYFPPNTPPPAEWPSPDIAYPLPLCHTDDVASIPRQHHHMNAAALIDTTLLDGNTAGATSVVGGGRLLTYGNNRIVGSAGSHGYMAGATGLLELSNFNRLTESGAISDPTAAGHNPPRCPTGIPPFEVF